MEPEDRSLILASASPRRAALLMAAGIAFEVASANVDETPHAAEDPNAYVRRLAELKAKAVAARLRGTLVLGADTLVVVDETMLGKPADAADAARMLHKLSGRTHEVLTAVALVSTRRTDVRVAVTRVVFAELSDEEIHWYVSTGEPMDKAGAYAIQGQGSRFVERIEGSYSNVVGLPVAVVYRMLSEARS